MSKKEESQHGSNLKQIAPMKLFTPTWCWDDWRNRPKSQAWISWDTAPTTTPGNATSRFSKMTKSRFGVEMFRMPMSPRKTTCLKLEDSKLQLEVAASVRGGHSNGRWYMCLSAGFEIQKFITSFQSIKRTDVTSNWTAQLLFWHWGHDAFEFTTNGRCFVWVVHDSDHVNLLNLPELNSLPL